MTGADFIALKNAKRTNKDFRRLMSLKYRHGSCDPEKIKRMDSFDFYRSKVLFLDGKNERGTAWFHSEARAFKAFEIVKRKFSRAIIYVD